MQIKPIKSWLSNFIQEIDETYLYCIGMILVVFLSSCNSAVEDSTPPAEQDTIAPYVLSSTPSNGAKPVSVITDINITFSEPIDPQSVNAYDPALGNFSQVKLLVNDQAVAIALDYNATNNTLGILPRGLLSYDSVYTIALIGIKDIAGNRLQTNIKFTTFTNSVEKDIYYSYDAAGNRSIAFYFGHLYDTTHPQEIRFGKFTDAGSDGQWFTSRDTPESLIFTTLDRDTGYIVERAYYGSWEIQDLTPEQDPTGSGANGIWYDTDDIPYKYFDYQYGPNGKISLLASYFIGLSQNPSMPTPTPSSSSQHPMPSPALLPTSFPGPTMPQNRYPIPPAQATATAGPNGLWRAPLDPNNDNRLPIDDTPSVYTRYQYDANGNLVKLANYTGSIAIKDITSGADGTWFTQNDDDIAQLHNYFSNDYDTNNRVRIAAYYGPSNLNSNSEDGADDKWFTEDDIPDSYNSYTYDYKGNKTLDAYYSSATGSMSGPDSTGFWFTDGAIPESYIRHSYNAQGQPVISVRYVSPNKGPSELKAGLEGRFTKNAGDYEFVNSYARTTYDSNNNKIRSGIFIDPGQNQEWFSFVGQQDDVISTYSYYEYNSADQQTLRADYSATNPAPSQGAGPLRFDENDIPYRYYRFRYDNSGNLLYTGFYAAMGSPMQAIKDLSPGGDLNWFTADDQDTDYISTYSKYVYDSNGNRTIAAVFDLASVSLGQGGASWFTGNDVPKNYTRSEYNENNAITLLAYYSSSINSVANLSDSDIPFFYIRYGYNILGNQTYNSRYATPTMALIDMTPEVGGSWFTSGASDIIFLSTYSLTKFDNTGNRISIDFYTGPSNDGLWYDGNDELSTATNYETYF